MCKYLALTTVLLMIWSAAFAENDEVAVVEAYFEAFNFHDVDGMMALLADDVRWMSIGDNELAMVTDNRDDLAAGLKEYFFSVPTARSRIRSIAPNGEYVAIVEEALWKDGNETMRQCATTVYQVSDGAIVNVWYFGELRCGD